MRTTRLGGPIVCWCLLAAGASLAACPPEGFDRAELDALKQAAFVVEAEGPRAELAIGLVDCLAHADPTLRDGIAFEAYYTWMRAKALPPATLRQINASLQDALREAAPDAAGFRKPFAALALAEVARTDRIESWLTAKERATLLRTAVDYVASVHDYRGFDAAEGWRHGVAHGADLLMQLALNPALTRIQLDSILGAVVAQIAPPGEVFYRYGESERLMRPVLFVAARGLHTEAEWAAWLARVASPAPMGDWREAFTTDAGLAKKHNTSAFLQALYLNVGESEDAAMRARLMPGLKAAVRALP